MITVKKAAFVWSFNVDGDKRAGDKSRRGVTIDGMSATEAMENGSPEQQVVARKFVSHYGGGQNEMTEVQAFEFYKQFPEFLPGAMLR